MFKENGILAKPLIKSVTCIKYIETCCNSVNMTIS